MERFFAIVNPAAGPISKEQITDLYLARGSGWVLIDQLAGSAIYVEFYKKATGRDVAQIKAIWSRILFTGRGFPPKHQASMVDPALCKAKKGTHDDSRDVYRGFYSVSRALELDRHRIRDRGGLRHARR